jgi:hypothetical protein
MVDLEEDLPDFIEEFAFEPVLLRAHVGPVKGQAITTMTFRHLIAILAALTPEQRHILNKASEIGREEAKKLIVKAGKIQ